MELADIKRLQHAFDDEHGWNLKSNDEKELLDMIRKDLIGLFGEIGEFSNIVKKLTLAEPTATHPISMSYKDVSDQLAEELIDAFIYVMRLASHLNIDIEAEYLKKLTFNKHKYRSYETK